MKESQVKTGQEETTMISLRVPLSLRDWIKTRGFSITKIFIEACKELGWKKK